MQRKSVSQDSYGAEIVSWAEFAEVWARIEPLTGREFWTQEAVQGETTTRIVVRYRQGVKVEDRVVWVEGEGEVTRTYDVLALIADERGTQLELMAKELVE